MWNLPEDEVTEPLRQHSYGDEPWQTIGLDFFEIAEKHYLAMVNFYSNFIEIDLITTMTSVCIVALFKKHCACHGIPRMIVSDRDPQFTSQEFNSFMEDWGMNHVTSRHQCIREPLAKQSRPRMSNSPTVPLVNEKREALKRSVKKDHVRKSRRLSKG